MRNHIPTFGEWLRNNETTLEIGNSQKRESEPLTLDRLNLISGKITKLGIRFGAVTNSQIREFVALRSGVTTLLIGDLS